MHIILGKCSPFSRMGGEDTFEEQFSVYATGVLDFYHAAQNLWKSAAAWLDGRTTQARRWFGWARHRLRHGQPDGGLADLGEALDVEG